MRTVTLITLTVRVSQDNQHGQHGEQHKNSHDDEDPSKLLGSHVGSSVQILMLSRRLLRPDDPETEMILEI